MIKKYAYRIAGILMCAIIVMGSVLTYQLAQEDEEDWTAQAAELPVNQYTDKSPLTVIEIVPYIMYAEFGYHIAGGELASLQEMEQDTEKYRFNQTGKDMSGLMGSFGGLDYVQINLPNEQNKPLFAFYSKEEFKRISLEQDYVSEALLKKQAIRKRLEREIAATNDEAHKENCRQKLQEYTYTGKEEENLRKFNNVKVTYKALLISEVNKDPSLLEKADLILITGVCASGASNSLKGYLKDEYAKKLKHQNDPSYEEYMKKDPYSYDHEERLSWNAADFIFKLSTELGGTPVIINKRALDDHYADEKKRVTIRYTALDEQNNRKVVGAEANETGCSNNMYKLFLMLYQKDPYVFRNDFYRYINEKGEFTLQSGEGKTYWNHITFMEYDYSNAANVGQNYSGNILLTNGMTWNSDNSFYQGFNSSTLINTKQENWGKDTGGCYVGNSKYSKDVLEYFGSDKTYITPAEAIRFLLANHIRHESSTITKTKLNVLELEPSNEFTINEDTVRAYLADYTGTINLTYMTSAQFNSTKTDLAATYDLIIMGANTGGLSLKDGNTNVYMATGDSTTTGIVGNKVSTTYSGNDIEEEKRKELADYLNAGRPIIMADTLYQKNNVDQSSIMYQFLNHDSTEAKEKNQIVELSKAELTPTTVTSQLIPYLEVYRPDVSNIRIEYSQSTLQASFTISGIESAGENKKLIAVLYATLDGKKETKETEIASSTIQSNGTYTIKASNTDIEKADPAISYRLVVKQEDQSSSYSTFFGTKARANTNIKTIKVLQIAPNSNSKIDLTSSSDQVGKMIHQVTEEKIEVTKITVDEFTALYEATPYQSDNILTDQLLAYDVLIFGCSDTYPTISNTKGALDNVIDFIGYNRSVIFTNGVLQPVKSNSSKKTREAYEKLRNLAGMKNSEYTYSYINKYKEDGSTYTMYNCSAGDSKDTTATHATLVNDSPVSLYPYKIAFNSLTQKTTSQAQNNQFSSIVVKNEKSGIFQADLTKVTGYYAITNGDEAGRKQFSASPNDIRNNYYLYQYGTVWYSGIGCDTLNSGTEQEAKLFVNTIVGAYHSAPRSPEVSFVDTNKDSNGNESVFVDTDLFSNSSKTNKTLTFIPHDENGKSMSTFIYIKTNETIDSIGTVSKKGSGGTISLSNTRLESDTEYEMTINAEKLNGSNPTVYIYVKNENGIGMASCQIVRRMEFDLD